METGRIGGGPRAVTGSSEGKSGNHLLVDPVL